jgi:hypothetical protein
MKLKKTHFLNFLILEIKSTEIFYILVP